MMMSTTSAQPQSDQEQENGIAQLPADMLDEVVSKLPALDLLSASFVSIGWLHAVRSSLHRAPRHFPWLVLRRLRHPKSSSYSIHALDPYSGTWLRLRLSVTCPSSAGKQPSPSPVPSFLSGSARHQLYTLSASKMTIFRDPFANRVQTEAKGPNVWRQDPVVAQVGRWIVVAGGGFLADLDNGDAEGVGAVEVYDTQAHAGRWELAQPMPWKFEGSTYATWLSVAASDTRLYVVEKKTGWMSQFDPESKKWGPTRQMISNQPVSAWSIGTAGKARLLLVGAGKKDEPHNGAVTGMKVSFWEVDGDNLQVIGNKPEEAEMPAEMAKRLFPDFGSMDDARQRACSIQVYGTEHGGYVFDPANVKNGLVKYHLASRAKAAGMDGKEGKMVEVERWEWVPCPATVEDCQMEEVSVGCSPVTLNQLALSFL